MGLYIMDRCALLEEPDGVGLCCILMGMAQPDQVMSTIPVPRQLVLGPLSRRGKGGVAMDVILVGDVELDDVDVEWGTFW